MTQPADVNAQALSYAHHQATKSLAELAALMERTGADCARCLEGVSEEQAAFKPALSGAEGYDQEWSIKDVLAHLIDGVETINREIANLAAGRPTRPVTGIGVTSGGDRPIQELRQDLADLWVETARLVASLPEDGSLERVREHPWFGPLNFKEWIAFQRLHAMDHVQQMEKVKAHPGHPKA